jgi:hypothetical protein
MSQAPIESLLDVFGRAFEAKTLFREDRLLLPELAREAQPVIEALVESLETGSPIEQAHEACALVRLLSRRAALLSATPTALVALSEALFAALDAAGFAHDASFDWRLRVLAHEGYSAGRDERLSAENAHMLSASQVLTVLAPRCVFAFLSGRHEPERLAPVLDELGRIALRQDAASCLVDLSRLELDREEIARVVFDGLGTVASLGVVPVIHCPRPEAAAHVERFAAAAHGALFVPDFLEAVQAALEAAGHELKPRRRWGKDLFSRGKAPGSRP